MVPLFWWWGQRSPLWFAPPRGRLSLADCQVTSCCCLQYGPGDLLPVVMSD